MGLHWMKAMRRGTPFTLQEGRVWLEKAGKRFPPLSQTQINSVSAYGIPAEWVITPTVQADKVILFFHGGAYVAGSLHSHRGLVSRLTHATNAKTLSVDYRLAPEHPFPVGIDDAVTTYKWLLSQYKASQIILAGDSSGGGMVLATLLKIKEDALAMPAAGVLICPWLDLSNESPTIEKLARRDPVLCKTGLVRAAQMYARGQALKNPYISPLFGDLQNLPPLLIQVAGQDMISGDGITLAQKLNEAEGQVQLELWQSMVHVWHFFGNKIPEATQAFEQIGVFTEEIWTQSF